MVLRIGIVGGGSMGCAHAQDLFDVPDCKVTSLYDPHLQAATRFGVSVGADAAYYGCDWTAFVDSIDAAIVCTPHYLHFAQARALLNAGKHVLVEKPLAMNCAEGVELLTFRGDDQIFATCQHRRADGRWRSLKTFVQANMDRITNVRLICCHDQQVIYENADQWRADLSKSGGGIVVDTGNHINDVLFWIMEGRAHVTDSRMVKMANGIELNATVLARFTNGIMLSAVYSIEHKGPHLEVLEWASADAIVARYDTGVFFPGLETVQDGKSPARNFVAAIMEAELVQAPACEGLRVLAYTDEVYGAA